MKKVFFKTDPSADLNGGGVVNFADLARMKAAFFSRPGPPSGDRRELRLAELFGE